MTVDEFIQRWKRSGAAERANFQPFLTELCDLIGVERPDVSTKDRRVDGYTFERDVTDPISGNTKFIDLYKRDCFVLEAKQGSEPKKKIADPRQLELVSGEALLDTSKTGTAVRGTAAWAKAMVAARQQAYNYATMLHAKEGWPPFLIIVDVGHVIELYADFSGIGKNYTQFQDGSRFRISLEDLHDEAVRETLRLVWTDPHALDPAKKTARVTRKIADQLAALGNSFEEQGHKSDLVARFLMRCLFTMFAEDVELIPKESLTKLLVEMRGRPKDLQGALQELWDRMNTGGYSGVLRSDLLRFNGGLFAEAIALPVNEIQLGLLIAAAEADWRDVEPAIFGTLLERALSVKERHKLGAHYTPRAYVERLVTPTIIEPLRADWDAVKAAAFSLADQRKVNDAIDTVRKFHRDLCDIKVLDPACGSGNFLYVAMEQMKRLEGEVIGVLRDFGFKDVFLTGIDMDVSEKVTVDPHQFLGIEINPWAAAVAELVLWIGYLQWHFKTFGKATPAEPVLKDFHNIECRDALLDLKGERLRLDADGRSESRWDGETYMTSATGQRVPDPDARREIVEFDSAGPTSWPEADFIIGNPPFIGASRMRDALGDGYTETLWKTYPKMPESADFVMFWWEKAAHLASIYQPASGKSPSKGVRRFGFITTNSLRQEFARRVLEPHLTHRKKPVSLLFAIPDHPWVDSKDGAAVRIAMTVAAAGKRDGRLVSVIKEWRSPNEDFSWLIETDQKSGHINANLTVGPDVTQCISLLANRGLASKGVTLHGQGFAVSQAEAQSLIRSDGVKAEKVVRPYLNGRDLVQNGTQRWAIDLFGLSEDYVQNELPAIYRKLIEEVKPHRMQNNRAQYRDYWWIFGEPRKDIRPALEDLDRIIVTARTAKHRVFLTLDSDSILESEIVCIAIDGFDQLAVLSSRLHTIWALACGSVLGPTPRYTKSTCFDPFPFPVLTPAQSEKLSHLGEQLDAYRKARQTEHPQLTLTGMYNVLERAREIEASRSGEILQGRDREIYEQAGIARLRDLHAQIDVAVADAYGWPTDLSEEEILSYLVALNRERALEEAVGNVKWLRPDYQNPTGETGPSKTGTLELEDQIATGKLPWPKELPTQMATVRAVLSDLGSASVEQVSSQFVRAQRKTIKDRLEVLAALGQAERLEDDRYAA
tara:strand:- start:1432 stop:4926 length:3495 start_codon:yes stop_codon:yes gene_type:complete